MSIIEGMKLEKDKKHKFGKILVLDPKIDFFDLSLDDFIEMLDSFYKLIQKAEFPLEYPIRTSFGNFYSDREVLIYIKGAGDTYDKIK